MTQKTFDFFSSDPAENKKIGTRPGSKKKRRRERGQLGFDFIKPKRKPWPFCEHCRIRRAATQRWMIGQGSSLKPAMFRGKPICKVCFGRSDDEIPLTIDDFAEKRNDYDNDLGGFSWSSDGDE